MKQELLKIKKCWRENQERVLKLSDVEREYWTELYNEICQLSARYCQQEEVLDNCKIDDNQITQANQNLQNIRKECLDIIKTLSGYLKCDSEQPKYTGQAKQVTKSDGSARPGAVSIRSPKGTYSTGTKRQ